MSPQSFYTKVALAILGLSASVNAHTWVEQMMVVAPNGTMVGSPGFARGNVLRSNPDFSDPTMVNLIPPNGRTINTILSTDLMCKSTQTTQTQTDGSPRLQAAPGSSIALRYQENGHVTLPQNQPGKPSNRGTVYVYGTTQSSSSDTLTGIHRVWTPDGTGGDGRGVLLSTQNFDDGQCYQINDGTISTQRQQQFPHTATSLTGADMWCQQDVALPANAPSGQPYTLYWVWDWPTLPGTAGFPDGKQELYTTCMDVDVQGSSGVQSAVSGNSFIAGQDLNSAAISSEVVDITNPTAVTGSTIPFSGATGAAATAAPSAGAISGTATEFSITTDGSGAHSIISASSAPLVPAATTIPAFGTSAASSATATATSSPGSGSGFDGHHSHGGQSQSAAPATTAAFSDANAGAQFAATVTDWDSVTMTVFQTVFNTNIPKRMITQTLLASSPTEKSASTASGAASTYNLRGRLYIVPGSGVPVQTD